MLSALWRLQDASWRPRALQEEGSPSGAKPPLAFGRKPSVPAPPAAQALYVSFCLQYGQLRSANNAVKTFGLQQVSRWVGIGEGTLETAGCSSVAARRMLGEGPVCWVAGGGG